MFVNHKRSSSNLRSQTIIIQAEDSLLEQSQIKQFINKNINRQANNINICYNDEYVQSLGSIDSERNNYEKNNLRNTKSLLNNQKNKYSNFSNNNFMKTTNQFNSTIKSSLSLQSNKAYQINPFLNTQSLINPQKSAFKIRSALNLNRKEKIENLIENKKLWSLKLLAKSQSAFSLKKKQRFSPINNSKFKKDDQKTNSLLKTVESSTWLSLNPQKIKKSLIILSKNDKITRAQIFNSKQASKTLNNNIKYANKIAFGSQNRRSLQKKEKNILVKPILALSTLNNFKTQKKKFQLDKILQSKGLLFKNPFRKIVSKHEYIENIQSQYI